MITTQLYNNLNSGFLYYVPISGPGFGIAVYRAHESHCYLYAIMYIVELFSFLFFSRFNIIFMPRSVIHVKSKNVDGTMRLRDVYCRYRPRRGIGIDRCLTLFFQSSFVLVTYYTGIVIHSMLFTNAARLSCNVYVYNIILP